MGQAEQEFPWLARQLSWDERSDSVFSHLSSEESHGSSESLNDQIRLLENRLDKNERLSSVSRAINSKNIYICVTKTCV